MEVTRGGVHLRIPQEGADDEVARFAAQPQPDLVAGLQLVAIDQRHGDFAGFGGKPPVVEIEQEIEAGTLHRRGWLKDGVALRSASQLELGQRQWIGREHLRIGDGRLTLGPGQDNPLIESARMHLQDVRHRGPLEEPIKGAGDRRDRAGTCRKERA
ncbi:hypothetical protein [Granulicoccus sp. GXG6511]|uniref:hypothetical protein n=1 Tax=Granulicoccus sp. GXG6511 TaxID=3381351 RepID=UPI003D7D1F5A